MSEIKFIVTSHGWSASNWLAYSLNLHDHILCSHSALNALPTEKEMHEESKLKKNIRKFHKGYSTRVEASLTDNYNEILNHGRAKAYGSVHLYRMRDLPLQFDSYNGELGRFVVMNLVRNPIDLVWSGYGQFQQLFRFDLNELHWTLGKLLKTDKEFVFDIGEKYGIEIGLYENLAFFCACRVLESLEIDLKALNDQKLDACEYFDFQGFIQKEKMTTDPDYFKNVLNRIGLDDDEITDEYLTAVFSSGKINKHKVDKLEMTPKKRYEGLSDWQKEVFNHFFNKYEMIRTYYSEMNYDLSFVD